MHKPMKRILSIPHTPQTPPFPTSPPPPPTYFKIRQAPKTTNKAEKERRKKKKKEKRPKMVSNPPPPPPQGPQQPLQPRICSICPSPCAHPQCHITCGTWRCCQCRAENLYNVLWCVCDHLRCGECALAHEGCQISRGSSGKRGEPLTEPPAGEREEGWSSEGWETSDDGKGGKEKEKEKKQASTCWMFWECCECGANNAPARGKCRECDRVKCDWCYRRLPKKAAVVGDFM